MAQKKITDAQLDGIAGSKVSGNISGNAANITGTVAIANGGTNITTYATGDLLYASATDTLSKLAAGTNTYVLTLAAGVPTWAAPSGGSPGGATTQLQYNNAGAFGGIANVTSDGTNLTAATIAGNLTFSGNARRIIGDFTNATIANRTIFQTSTTNGATGLVVTPNGTGNYAGIVMLASSSAVDCAYAGYEYNNGVVAFVSARLGTGTAVPMDFRVGNGGDQAMRIQTNGNVNIGTTLTDPSAKLRVEGLLLTDATDASEAGLRLPHGTAPSAPTNGDVWTTTAGMYVRVNGGTVGPLAATPALTDNRVVVGTGTGIAAVASFYVDETWGDFAFAPPANAAPGPVSITASSTNATNVAGGDVNIYAGAGNGTGRSGDLSMGGGNSVNASQSGRVRLYAGAGNGAAAGGEVRFEAGAGGATDAVGGAVIAIAGTGGGAAAGGAISLTAGAASGTGNGGAVTIASGTPTAGNGGDITVTAAAGVGTNKNGGNVTLTAGAKTGSGTDGVINLVIPATGALQINGAAGTATHVLTSNGPTTAPTWQAAPGAVSEPANQLVYGTGGAVDSSAALTFNSSTFAFDIAGGSVATPGNVIVQGASSSGTAAGATVGLYAGNGGTTSGAGGAFTAVAGDAATSGAGGIATLNAGWAAGSASVGGDVYINSGRGAGSGAGGLIQISASRGGATGVGGNVSISAGAGGATSGNGGDITLSSGSPLASGSGGATILEAVAGLGTNQNGGAVTVRAGDATGSGTGGTVTISTGVSPTGTAGSLLLKTGTTASTTAVTISPAGVSTFAAPAAGNKTAIFNALHQHGVEIVGTTTNTIPLIIKNAAHTAYLGVYNGAGYTGTLTNHPFEIYTNDVKRMTIATTGAVDFTNTVTVRASGSDGYVEVKSGDATYPGYIDFRTAEGTRRGYIGYGDTGPVLNLLATAGYSWKMTGALEVTGTVTVPAVNASGIVNTYPTYSPATLSTVSHGYGNLVIGKSILSGSGDNWTIFGNCYADASHVLRRAGTSSAGRLALGGAQFNFYASDSGSAGDDLSTMPAAFRIQGGSTVEARCYGNFYIDGASKRLLGDFSNATIATRTLTKTLTTNGATHIGAIPDGTGTASSFTAYGVTDPDNSHYVTLYSDGSYSYLSSHKNGTGTTKPIRINCNANVCIDISTAGIVDLAAGATVGTIEIGYRNIPRSTTTTTAVVGDRGKCIAASAGITIPNATFAAGDTFSIYNDSAAAITITQGASLTLREAGTTNTGNRTLAPRGLATLWFNGASEAIITGAGVT